MPTITKQTTYLMTLNEQEIESLWYQMKYATADEEEEPKDFLEHHEKTYQAIRKILGKN